MKKVFLFIAGAFTSLSFFAQNKTIGSIERIDPEINSIIKADATIEILGDGFEWSEGPLWLEKEQMLLFSDIPKNAVFKWTAAKGVEPYLKPAGYTGNATRGGESGSNGLILTRDRKLLLCQHGDRRLAVMDAPLNAPQPRFKPVATRYGGKKLNSPNDAVLHNSGNIYFTDPPYGLAKGMDDPAKELSFQGVYKVGTNGTVTLLLDSITRPNGIAFTPDGKTVVIANSDENKAVWYRYDVAENGTLSNGSILRDVTQEMKREKGAPDGLKFSRNGYLFATGPGGVWVFNKAWKLIGKISIPVASANCALSADEKTLYITSHMYLLKLQMR